MSFKWEHNKDDNLKIPNPKGKIKWEKIDKDLYRGGPIDSPMVR